MLLLTGGQAWEEHCFLTWQGNSVPGKPWYVLAKGPSLYLSVWLSSLGMLKDVRVSVTAQECRKTWLSWTQTWRMLPTWDRRMLPTGSISEHITIQETQHGTRKWKKLQQIKSNLDPQMLYKCCPLWYWQYWQYSIPTTIRYQCSHASWYPMASPLAAQRVMAPGGVCSSPNRSINK